MKAFKGFNKDMTCRGFQFKEGETYETDSAKMCESGFHACENPLDCFGYYTPASSVYREVEIDDNGERQGDDSKVVGKKIKIGAALDVAGICKAHFEYVKSRCTPAKSQVAGDKESASAGFHGAASAGFRGAASAGEYGSASAGFHGSASAGEYGAASAGEYGAASAGFRGAASAGEYGAASAGEYGSASSRGSSSVGNNGIAIVRGNGCKAKGGIGALLVIAEEKSGSYDISAWKAVIVDGKKVKADTWYELKDGELQEVK